MPSCSGEHLSLGMDALFNGDSDSSKEEYGGIAGKKDEETEE